MASGSMSLAAPSHAERAAAARAECSPTSAALGSPSGARRARDSARCARTVLAGGAVLCALAVTSASTAEAAAGNGVDSMTPALALHAAAAALKVAPNVVLHGDLLTVSPGPHERFAAGVAARQGLAAESSPAPSRQSLVFVVKSANHDTESSGTIVSSSAAEGFAGTLHFVLTPAIDYFWGGSSFWTTVLAHQQLTAAQRAALVKAAAGVWIAVPAAQGAAVSRALGAITEPATLAQELVVTTGPLRKGTPKVIEGVRALPVVLTRSDLFGNSNGVDVWVSTVGAPLPLEVAATHLSAGDHDTVKLQYPPKLVIIKPAHAVPLATIVGKAGTGSGGCASPNTCSTGSVSTSGLARVNITVTNDSPEQPKPVVLATPASVGAFAGVLRTDRIGIASHPTQANPNSGCVGGSSYTVRLGYSSGRPVSLDAYDCGGTITGDMTGEVARFLSYLDSITGSG
jgi:hypothetical protein